MKQLLHTAGRKIAWYESGTKGGLPLVLLHGFCEDASLWDDLTGRLDDIRVIRIDLPGFGDSDLPPSPSMNIYAGAVHAALDALSVERFVLLGHSMGGYAALEYASAHPERLAGFGLIHSHPFEDSPERKEIRRRGIDMVRTGKRDLYVTQLFPGLFAEAFVRDYPDVVSRLVENGKRQSAEGIALALEGMIDRKDHLHTLRAAACPVLFLLGETDTVIPADTALHAAMQPDIADVHLLPGVGHMAMFEAPEKTGDIVRGFWEFCVRR